MTDMSSLRDWRFSIDEQQIAWAIFDREGESQNALGRRPLEELGAIVERVEAGARDRSIAGLAILSGKERTNRAREPGAAGHQRVAFDRHTAREPASARQGQQIVGGAGLIDVGQAAALGRLYGLGELAALL